MENDSYKSWSDGLMLNFDDLIFLFFQPKVYKTVVEDVINNVRESFLDECVDEQVLQELKQVK